MTITKLRDVIVIQTLDFSLCPEDIGENLKETKKPILLPRTNVRVKYKTTYGKIRCDEMSYAQTRFVLRRCGYVLARHGRNQ